MLKSLREKGKAAMAAVTGWAVMDKFVIFMQETGFFKLPGKAEGEGYKRKMAAPGHRRCFLFFYVGRLRRSKKPMQEPRNPQETHG